MLDKRGKILCITYLETKSFKTVQVKFPKNFNLNNYPQISQIYDWVHKFQAPELVNNLNKNAKNPRSAKKLTARCPDNVDAARNSLGMSPKSPSE